MKLVSREQIAEEKSEASDSPGFLALKLASCKARTKLDMIQAPTGNVLCQIFIDKYKKEKREQRALRKTLTGYNSHQRLAVRVT